MKLAYVFDSKSKFCGFESHLGHQYKGGTDVVNSIIYKNRTIKLEDENLVKRKYRFSDTETGDIFRAEGYGSWVFIRLTQSAFCIDTKDTIRFTDDPIIELYKGDIVLDDRDFVKYKEL